MASPPPADLGYHGFDNTPKDESGRKERKKVGFTKETRSLSPEVSFAAVGGDRGGGNRVISTNTPAAQDVSSTVEQSHPSITHPLDHTPTRFRRPSVSEQDVQDIHMAFDQPYVARPRPAIRKTNHGESPTQIELGSMARSDPGDATPEGRAGVDAHQRASKLAERLGARSASVSRRNSSDSLESPRGTRHSSLSDGQLDGRHDQKFGEASDDDVLYYEGMRRQPTVSDDRSHQEAHRLVRTIMGSEHYYDVEDNPLQSGQNTPMRERQSTDYVRRPKKFVGGVTSALMELYNARGHAAINTSLRGSATSQHARSSRRSRARKYSNGSATGNEPPSLKSSPPQSGTVSPASRRHKHLRNNPSENSLSSVAQLVGSSSNLGLPPPEFAAQVTQRLRNEKRFSQSRRSRGSAALLPIPSSSRREEYRVTVHIATIIDRQRYLLTLCRSLMSTGAPTHRLDEYMRYSARALEVQAQFMYLPGCMIISFDDTATHTADVKLVKTATSINLGKLRDVHEIYKEVLRDHLLAAEATSRLEAIMKAKKKYSPWVLVVMYGFASATVGPFAFEARFIDLPIAFVLGSLLGWLQLIVAPKSDLYANVFEISASVLTSFLARAFGSIRGPDGDYIFCFSALAQSSIALILPGYTVLCSALELQSKQIVPGSIRLVYAILYSLFLGFGITIGTVIFGIMDTRATSATTCNGAMSPWWHCLFVPAFTLCLIIINQAKWRQAPVMMVISSAGYAVNYFAANYMRGNTQVSNTLGAFVIGALANLYSRLGRRIENWCLDVWEQTLRPTYKKIAGRRYFATAEVRIRRKDGELYLPRKRRLGYGLAAAAMLPAIFVQVPSGLAVNGSLISGITSADQILSNSTGTTVPSVMNPATVNSTILTFGYSVVQVSIGITVGLFLAALAVYPFGKRSGLFSF